MRGGLVGILGAAVGPAASFAAEAAKTAAKAAPPAPAPKPPIDPVAFITKWFFQENLYAFGQSWLSWNMVWLIVAALPTGAYVFAAVLSFILPSPSFGTGA